MRPKKQINSSGIKISKDSLFYILISHWKLKIFLGGIIVITFFAIFFLLQRYPLFPVKEMKESYLDLTIPFNPNAVYLYESLWFLIPIAPWLMNSKKDLFSYCKGVILMSILAFVIFFLYPTYFRYSPNFPHSNQTYAILINIDNGRNAFPSLHAAFALFTALCFSLRYKNFFRVIIWIWAIAILYSTLMIKQHVLLDIIAGTILGIISYIFFIFIRKNKKLSHYKKNNFQNILGK